LTRIALVTSAEHPELWLDDHPLRDALVVRGADVSWPLWDDPAVDWESFDLTVIRSVWDYTWRHEEFLAWARAVDRQTALWNPLPVIEWNSHKRYLRDLEHAGVPVVPTHWLPTGEAADVSALCADHGWSEAVLKPAVSAGGRDTLRFAADAPADAQRLADRLLPVEELMLQPYMSSVETTGERSMLYVDRVFAHAVRRPPYLDAGLYAESVPADPETDELDVAAAVLAAVPHDLLYARVDLVRDDAGVPRLAEVELIEPQLFLRLSPLMTDRLAHSVLAAAQPTP
jgi:glutathione synthase/RimK-type ligase-like ATP-grasp enzyme